MSTPLRPMTAGELLDRTVNLYRRNFMLFFGIGVLPAAFQLVLDVAHLAFIRFAGASGAIIDALSTLLLIAISLIGLAIAEGATLFGVSAVHLDRNTGIRECYARLRGRYLRVSGLILVLTAIVIGIGVVILLVVFIAAVFIQLFLPLPLREGLIPGAVIVALGILFYVTARYAIAAPACVLEDLGIRDSLRRSTYLTRHDRRRIFVISVLSLVIFYGTMWALLGPFVLLAGERLGETSLLRQTLDAVANFTAQALVGPIGTISFALLYYDERVRKEAFDLQLMMAALDKPIVGATSAATK